MEQPMQPIYLDNHGTARFWPNKVVQYILDNGGIDLNTLAIAGARGVFTKEDQEQFAQLIGYSVSGFGDLPYVRPRIVNKADRRVEKIVRNK